MDIPANGHRPLKWAIYARVSTVEQAGPDSASIDTQLANCRTLIEREGGGLVDTYVDDKPYKVGGRLVEPSGERADRPEFLRMLADLKDGRVNAVASFHVTRLYRDYRPHAEFIEVARAVKPVVKLWHGEWSEQFSVFGAWLGYEDNRHRTAQTAKGRRAKAEKGFAPTLAPLFYRTVRNERGKRTGHQLIPAYRAWLDELARLFLAGLPYDDIAQALGTNPATGRRLGKSTVARILGNRFMFGLVELDRYSAHPRPMTVAGQHEAAWDADTCAAIERELARRARHGKSFTHGGKFAFSGLLRCGYAGCGRLLTGSGTARRWPSYACVTSWRIRRGYEAGTPHAPNTVTEGKLRQQLVDLGAHLTYADALEQARALSRALPTAPSAWHAEVAKLRADLSEIGAELAALPETAKRARANLEQDQTRLARRLAALEAVTPPAEVPAVPPEEIAQRILDFFALDLLAAPRDVIQARFPWDALYVRGGEIVAPPDPA